MNKYIDIDAIGIGKADRNVFTVPEYADGWNSAIEIMQNAPTADVVEVVRCYQCKWWKDKICTNVNGARGFVPNGYWYCASGEREGKEALTKDIDEMEIKIKHCCKCGGRAVLVTVERQEDDEGKYTFDMFYIECVNCGNSTDCEYTEEDAMNEWNRRTNNGT